MTLATLLEAGFAPFTLSLALLVGLFVLELAALLLGNSLLAGDSDADLDLDGTDLDGLEVDAPDGAAALGATLTPEIAGFDLSEVDLSGTELEGVDLDTLQIADAPAPVASSAGGVGVFAWLGIGKMPLMIWLACFLMAFGLAGVGGQLLLRNLAGLTAPAGLMSLPAAAIAIWFTRGFGTLFARLLPQNKTEALSERSLGRRRGLVTQGTAKRGRPAEVRVVDGYGNAHYLRAEPLEDSAEIAKGTEVLVIRDRRNQTYVLLPLSD